LLNISGKIDQNTIESLGIVDEVAKKIGTPYLVVGATARDMLMHFGYGAAVQRATADLDFAIQLPDWETYASITDRLVVFGFKRSKQQQRLFGPGAMPIDLVPFGGVADDSSNIRWPPTGETVMDVTGFQDAYASSIQVTVRETPVLNIPIASPQGQVLLKLIAWSDRDADLRQKDAKDIAYLLMNYQIVGGVLERLYELMV